MKIRTAGFWVAFSAISLAGPAWCLDPEALAKSQYPADGTFDQSDLCAAGFFVMYATMGDRDVSNNPDKAKYRDNVFAAVTRFSEEAARLKDMHVRDYQTNWLPRSVDVVKQVALQYPQTVLPMMRYCASALTALRNRPDAQAPAGASPDTAPAAASTSASGAS